MQKAKPHTIRVQITTQARTSCAVTKPAGFRRSQRVDLDHCGDRISIGTVLGHL
jgi:hypothetical protein